MLKTPLCDLFGIEVPIILAPMGTCTSAELAAAVSNEGGLGGVGSLFRTTAAIKRDIDVVRELTNRHYAVNHIPPTLDADAFRYTLQARPAVISISRGFRPSRAHSSPRMASTSRSFSGVSTPGKKPSP